MEKRSQQQQYEASMALRKALEASFKVVSASEGYENSPRGTGIWASVHLDNGLFLHYLGYWFTNEEAAEMKYDHREAIKDEFKGEIE